MSSYPSRQTRREARTDLIGGRVAAAEHYGRRGARMMVRKKLKSAGVLLRTAVQLNAEAPKPYVYLAICEARLTRTGEARRTMADLARCAVRNNAVEAVRTYIERKLRHYPYLQQAFYLSLIELDRTSGAPFAALGSIALAQSDWSEAQKYLLQGLRTKTSDREIGQGLRELYTRTQAPDCLAHLERFEEGKLSRSDLIALLSGNHASESPSQEPELKDLISDLEAELQIPAKENYDDVAPLIREFTMRADRIVRSDPKARMDLALAFFEMGLTSNAREQLKGVPPESPVYLEAQCLLAEILLSEGRALEALEVYQSCLRAEPLPVSVMREARYRLVDIYLKLGDLGQALIHYRELERKAPDYRNLRSLRQRLETALGASVNDSGPKTGMGRKSNKG
jgi:tetratricopeptide (TPR) repeat protein